MYDPHDESVCPQCGYRLLHRKEAYDSYESEEQEPVHCPRCQQRKPYGFFYSE